MNRQEQEALSAFTDSFGSFKASFRELNKTLRRINTRARTRQQVRDLERWQKRTGRKHPMSRRGFR